MPCLDQWQVVTKQQWPCLHIPRPAQADLRQGTVQAVATPAPSAAASDGGSGATAEDRVLLPVCGFSSIS